MATRSTISIKKSDGSFEQVYCHWDGYPSHNGFILLLYYQDIKKINKLFENGDISSLSPEVDIPKGKNHSFENKIEGVTVFYGRDRGDVIDPPPKFKNEKTFAKDGNFQEYDYVFDEISNKWFLFKPDLVGTPDAYESLLSVVKNSYDDMEKEQKVVFDEFLAKPYEEAYVQLKEELSPNKNVGVAKRPKKPLPEDHPQLSLGGIESSPEPSKPKKMKV